VVTRLQLVERPHVLDGDHGLVGEGLEQRDLLVAERHDLGAAGRDRADSDAVAKQRHAQRRSIPSPLR
jgi:hypothetical protein